MKRIAGACLVLSFVTQPIVAQTRRMDQDPALDNLVHADGTITCELGSLGRVVEVGTCPQPMILIAGDSRTSSTFSL